MKTGQRVSKSFVLALCITLYGTAFCAQTVIHCPNAGESLAQRWKWAIAEANTRGVSEPYWIGYSFDKLMDKNSFIGSFYSDDRRHKPSLCELLELQPCPVEKPHMHLNHREVMSGNITINDNGDGNREKMVKPIGVLFEIYKGDGGSETIEDIKTSNLSLYADLDDEPVIWLGEADDSASVAFLQSKYDQHQSLDVQKNIVSTVGFHPASDLATSFLSRVLKDGERTEIRKDAAFWLGQSNADEALGVLSHVARNDESEEVMESAVFAISQMQGERSTDTLIALARTGDNDEMRKKAMFWLGQKASRKATATLESIANDNDNTEIQRNAVFALTQLSDNEGVEPLIKIAKTHPNPEVRKSAIFWLGQSDDRRALEALVEIVHN
jgi:hypothetical protein